MRIFKNFPHFFVDECLSYITKRCFVILWIHQMLYKRFLKYTSILMIMYLSVAYGTKYSGILKFNAVPFLHFMRCSCQTLQFFSWYILEYDKTMKKLIPDRKFWIFFETSLHHFDVNYPYHLINGDGYIQLYLDKI